MSDETAAAGGELDAAPVVSAPNLEGESVSVEQAFEAYQKKSNPTAESAEPATAENELSDEDNAGPEEVPGETQATDPAEELPPVEPPRSWTKEAKDRWNTIPREAQEEFARIEQGREREFLRSQQDAAEKLKGLTAKEQQAEQVRLELEAGVKAARDVLEREQRARFPDIKSWEDYERFSAEASRLSEIDPFNSLRIANYLKDFDTHQRSMQFNAEQAKQIEGQRAQERQSKRATYEAQENARLIELVPEMADPKKAGELRERAIAMLTDDLGLKNDQLSRWMQDDTGHEILSNAGIQKLIADGLKFREIKSAPPKAIQKPVPAVQRPGVAPPKGAQSANDVQALRNKLSGTGSVDDAFALYQAKRRRA